MYKTKRPANLSIVKRLRGDSRRKNTTKYLIREIKAKNFPELA